MTIRSREWLPIDHTAAGTGEAPSPAPRCPGPTSPGPHAVEVPGGGPPGQTEGRRLVPPPVPFSGIRVSR